MKLEISMKKIINGLVFVSMLFVIYGMSKPNVENSKMGEPKKTSAHAVSKAYVKPHAGIQFSYQQPKSIDVGETINIKLKFKNKDNAESLIVNINHDSALQLNNQRHYEFDLQTTKNNKLTLSVTGMEEGQFYIDVITITQVNGKPQARSLSIPIFVGDVIKDKARAPNSKYQILPEQGVISMPAIER